MKRLIAGGLSLMIAVSSTVAFADINNAESTQSEAAVVAASPATSTKAPRERRGGLIRRLRNAISHDPVKVVGTIVIAKGIKDVTESPRGHWWRRKGVRGLIFGGAGMALSVGGAAAAPHIENLGAWHTVATTLAHPVVMGVASTVSVVGALAALHGQNLIRKSRQRVINRAINRASRSISGFGRGLLNRSDRGERSARTRNR